MKKWLWLGLLSALAVPSGGAMDWKTLQPEGYVSDFAQVIDPTTRAQIEAYCGSVERATGAQMALVTIRSLEGEPVEDVARAIFNDWGVGQRGKNDGIMLLLAVGDGRSRLEVGSGLQSILPNGLAGAVLSEMRPALRQQNYGEAMKAAAQTIGETVAARQGRNAGRDRAPDREADSFQLHPLAARVGRHRPFDVAAARGRTPGLWRRGGGGFLPGLILGGMMGRAGWGDRGSGGFGGPDSSDGFGGFGGGDSGGGGASGDW